jgi:carbon-monoxide dehydrogenase large subunit
MSDIDALARPSQYVGARVQRTEDARFLTGNGRYVDDIELPHMVHAAFVRSPLAHANVGEIDTAAAEAVDGVHLVITGRQLAETLGPVITVPGTELPGIATVPRRVLATDKVRFVGEAVAIVVAESRYIAEDAAELVEVDWQPLLAVVDPERALAPDAPTLHEEVPDNNLGELNFATDQVEAAFASAAHVFSKRLSCGRHQAAPIEARGAIGEWDPISQRGTLWTSNQMPHLVRSLLPIPFGLSEQHFRVIAPDVGGGFGNKSNLFMEDIATLCAARAVGRPVKWIEDRAEHLAASTHGKEALCELEMALDANSHITGLRGRFIGNVGAYTVPGPWSMVDSVPAATLLPGIYDVPEVAWTAVGVLSNKCCTAAYRGVGMSNGQAVRELLLDEAARALEIDPVELRLRNCIGPEPGHITATNMRYDGGSYEQSIRDAAELVDYPAFRERQAALRKQGRYIGVGFSAFVEPTGFGSAISNALGIPSTFFDAVNVTVQPDGTVTVRTGLHSHGQGHETTFAQAAADAVGVALENVRVVQGDTETTPYGMGTYASRSAVVGGGAIIRAGAEVRAKLVDLAAHILEAAPADIELRDGIVSIVGNPQQLLTVADIAGFAYFGGPARPPEIEEPALTSTRSYDPAQTYSNGCVVALLEVDPKTGGVTIDEIVAVEDCGTMINPMIVDGQVAGAIAQGIGSALLEELVYGEDGQLLTGSLMDYLYPSTMEVPPIRIRHITTPSDVTEGGIKGVGEGGTVAAPAAVLNAIADALAPFGAVVDRMPFRPQDIWNAAQQSSLDGD